MNYMDAYIHWLPVCMQSRLFYGMPEDDVRQWLLETKPEIRTYGEGAVILPPDAPADRFGLVLAGRVWGERTDADGNRSVAGTQAAGSVFGEILAMNAAHPRTVEIRAERMTTVMLFDYSTLFLPGKVMQPYAVVWMRNLLSVVGDQYFALADRINCLTQRTLRDKLLTYLTDAAKKTNSAAATVPFTHEELASYLAAERSAVSRELNAMRREGKIGYRGKQYRVLSAKSDEIRGKATE